MDSMEDSGFDSDQKPTHLNDTEQSLVITFTGNYFYLS